MRRRTSIAYGLALMGALLGYLTWSSFGIDGASFDADPGAPAAAGEVDVGPSWSTAGYGVGALACFIAAAAALSAGSPARGRSRRVAGLWLGCAVLVAGAWVLGGAAPWRESLVVATIGTGVAVLAGAMMRRGAGHQVLGCVVLAGLVVVLAVFASFGGFCLDERDVCQTTWSSRAVALGAGLVPVLAGWAVAARRRVGSPP